MVEASLSPDRVRAHRETSRDTLAWIDALKGLAIVWIVWNHISERIFGGPYAANPTHAWPALSVRLSQIAPIGHGSGSIATNLARYIGWTGDQGVGLFIVASGFLLALSHAFHPSRVLTFYRRRLLRIYPQWIAVHIAFVVLWFVIGKGLNPTDPRTFASVLGLRFLPSVFYYFVPAWWYVGLALQLYLIFPFLASLMARFGALRFTLACAVAGCLARLVGLYAFGSFVDEWSRGGIFITRLPEFALGMGLASAYVADPDRIRSLLRAPAVVVSALVIWLLGNALSLTLEGMSVAPLLLSASAFVLAYSCVISLENVRLLANPMQWCGKHSYAIYLVHQPFVAAFVTASAVSLSHRFTEVAAVLAASLVAALALEWTADRGESAILER